MKNNRLNAGIILVTLVLTAVAAPLSLNKVSPIAQELMDYFNIAESQLGMLISVFSLAGIILALPGGMLIRRFGAWKCVYIALFALLSGTIAGIYAGSFTILLASRIVEGIGMGFMAVAAPSIISETFSSGKRGLAMGLFSTYMGIGQVLTYNIAPRIVRSGGWQSVWRLAAIYTIIVLIIWFMLSLKRNAFSRERSLTPVIKMNAGSFTSVAKNKNLWYLAISLLLYNASYVSIQTFLPSYLFSNRGLTMAASASLTSICCLTGTVASVFSGILSDKLGSRRVLGGMSLIISAALFLLIPAIPTFLFLPFLIILGIIPPILPVCVFAAASEVIDNPSEAGISMGIINLGQNIGLFAGPVIFGVIIQELGWIMAFIFTVPAAAAGGLVMLASKKAR